MQFFIFSCLNVYHYVPNASALNNLKPGVNQWEATFQRTKDFRQFIAGCTVENVWPYPVRCRLIFVGALEWIFVLHDKNNFRARISYPHWSDITGNEDTYRQQCENFHFLSSSSVCLRIIVSQTIRLLILEIGIQSLTELHIMKCLKTMFGLERP